MNKTRQDLEYNGYTFLPGHLQSDGRFLLVGMPADHTPPYLDDLIGMGYIRVKGGIMEPPRANKLASLALFGLLAGGIYFVSQYMGGKNNE